MAYTELRLLVDPADAERASALLFEAGATGVEERGGAERPPPGSDRLDVPPGKLCLRGFFGDEQAARHAARHAGVDQPDLHPVREADWSAAWRDRHEPMEVSPGLWVAPPWRAAEVPADALAILMEPGMAFGTGEHATTQLALRRAALHVGRRPGLSVCDVGCGTGILAITCRKLGAGRVAAVDLDPRALESTLEHMILNRCDRIDLRLGDAAAMAGTFDLVLANILLDPILREADAIARRVADDGILCLTGLLFHQEEQVVERYCSLGFEHLETCAEGMWVLVELRG